ncbi:MAG: hypothetical protein JXO22_09870 [Phycisphaerae bacterium]|nr:hypothetical protein [Phycisphaerae bacterium]
MTAILAFGAAYLGGRALVSHHAPSLPMVRIVGGATRYIGVRCAGERIEETFTLENIGAVLARVCEVQTSCGCTNYVVECSDIPLAGTSALVLITTLPSSTREETHTMYYADAFFDGLANPVRAVFEVTVVSEVPAVIDFGRILPNSGPCMREFRVHGCAGPLEVVAAESDNAAVGAEIVRSTARSQEDAVISVTLRPPEFPGDFVARIRVVYTEPTHVPGEVAVRASIASRIECEPQSILFGVLENGRTYARTMRIESTVGERFDITDMRATLPNVSCSASPTSAGRTEYVAQTNCVAPSVLGSFAGTVEIETSDARCPLVVIPVYGVCGGGENDAALAPAPEGS